MGTSGINEILFLLQGLKWTLLLSAIGFVGGIVFGLVIALLRRRDRTGRCAGRPPR